MNRKDSDYEVVHYQHSSFVHLGDYIGLNPFCKNHILIIDTMIDEHLLPACDENTGWNRGRAELEARCCDC